MPLAYGFNDESNCNSLFFAMNTSLVYCSSSQLFSLSAPLEEDKYSANNFFSYFYFQIKTEN